MAEKPIIQIWLVRFKTTWDRLSKEEQMRYIEELHSEVIKNLEKIGAKFILECDCRWSNGKWAMFGVIQYPNVRAVQSFIKFLEEAEFFQYYHMETYLGTPIEPWWE